MHAIITVGLGFGDEGKGATVDFLARHHNADWVVRYCGGAQAGHNVQLPGGQRHTFSQFGAGTFSGARTYLGSRVIINPATLVPESDHLETLGVRNPKSLLTIHPKCLVSTVYQVTMNRIRETARGDTRHGSCGLGIGETRHYWLSHGHDAIVASDLRDRVGLVDKLTLMRDRFLLQSQSMQRVDKTLAEDLYESYPEAEADLLIEAIDGVSYSPELPPADVAIFEGSQGVLLDETYGFHPYTTWSTVTTHHAMEMIRGAGVTSFEVLGLTRAYMTRHGAGPFPTRCDVMTRQLHDVGNPENDWQGAIACGPLDRVLLRYACDVNRIDALVVNNVDELPDRPRMCRRYRNLDRLTIPHGIDQQQQLTDQLSSVQPQIDEVSRDELMTELSDLAPVKIIAEGPCHTDRRIVNTDESPTWDGLPACQSVTKVG